MHTRASTIVVIESVAPDFLSMAFVSFGGMSARRLKWWHWVLIAIVVLTAVDWIWSGENPLTSFEKGLWRELLGMMPEGVLQRKGEGELQFPPSRLSVQ
jgi:hypothetical protein